jgi:two-component system, response regulator
VHESVEILLVEDNSSDADLTIHAFRKGKIVNNIQLLRDGAEALDFLFCRGVYSDRQFDKPPRLILLDLKLPKIDGLGVLREIKRDIRTRAIPVVLLTSSSQESDMATSYKLGVNSYIQKRLNFSDFQNVANQIGVYWLLLNSNPPAAAFSHS